ncbi:MAG: GNAT family N-acetyltransferase [Deltaproteobacteria bacterium]
MAEAPLWRRYGYGRERCAQDLSEALERGGDALFCAELEQTPVGLAWVLPRGAFGRSPYLRLIAVAESARGKGIGALLLREAERLTGELFLLVSEFNAEARRFYAREGYVQVGALPGFVLPDVTELLLRKQAEA